MKNMPECSCVKRDGKYQRIETQDLVPGDFIYLSTGTFDYWHIPGDIRIIHINQPVVVESYFLYKDCLNYLKEMTKEQTSEDPLKTNNLLFRGTTLFSGDCIGLVFHTGENMLLNNVPDDLLATPELPESEDEDKEDGGGWASNQMLSFYALKTL